MMLRITEDAGRIKHMTQHPAVGTVHYILRPFGIALQLKLRVLLLVRAIGHAQMREHTADLHFLHTIETTHQLRQFIADESHAVHTGVELDMDGITAHAVLARLAYHILQHPERIYFRL